MSEPAQLPTGPAGVDGAADGGVPPALRVQILATEHWSLLATRSLAWNEVWARGGMFLSALAGAIIALALVGQGTGFDSTFAAFGIVILPVVLFLGETTYLRMNASNLVEAMTVVSMNRIRHAYLEMAPDLAPYFVTSAHDDLAGVAVTMGRRPGRMIQPADLLAGTPIVVLVINGVVAGAIAGLILVQAGLGGPIAIGASVAVFLLVVAVHAVQGRRRVASLQANAVARFPGEPSERSW
jgi:hypothetical protein